MTVLFTPSARAQFLAALAYIRYLKSYAAEEERRQWTEEWPDYTLPEHERPPFDRDRHLPAPNRTELMRS